MNQIPKKIHFIYGLAEDFGGKEFCFMHWAAIKSALKKNPDYEIHYWYEFLPINNYYFEDIKNSLVLHKIEAPTEIFGNKLYAIAHQADVLRMSILKDIGGIYLDIDTFTKKSFNELLSNVFFIGEQEVRGSVQGLCNAVMGSIAHSVFIEAWYSEYKDFRSKGYDEYWAEHSVSKPFALSKKFSDHLTILPAKLFLKPDYSPEGMIELLYLEKEYPEAVCHHLWESGTFTILGLINEQNIRDIKNSYSLMVLEVLEAEIDLLASLKVYKVIEKSSIDFHMKKTISSLLTRVIEDLKI